MPLDQFIPKGHPNLKEITQPNQIPTNGDFMIMAGAPWCPHCKNQLAVMNETCKNLKKTKCLVVDGDSQQGRALAQNIGLKVQAFPTNALCKHDEKTHNTQCSVEVGSMPKESLNAKLKANNLN